MGVPKFYRWISERYPCLSEVVRDYQIPEIDNLYLDMNGIIHNCSHPNDDDVHFRISEVQILEDIFKYIDFLFKTIKPQKVFFMAVDGVAPRAKMNQQRGRRFRSAKEAEDREKEARRKGEVLPKEARFDSNCITPGTEFMVKLNEHLKYFVTLKISKDPAWQGVKVYLSGHETPGEGEHKIMDFIRYQKSLSEYDPNTRHCLYGLDADLMMLGICSHEPRFSLLREEVRFIRTKDDKKMSRRVNPENITFHLLHLSLLRDYLDHEFSALKSRLPFEYKLESILDDWILMGFLVGNDFIPHIPHFHINKNSLLRLYEAYIAVMPTLDGYLNESGTLNLKRFQKFVKQLSDVDYDNFNEIYADLQYFDGKTGDTYTPREAELERFHFDNEVEDGMEPRASACNDNLINFGNETEAINGKGFQNSTPPTDEDELFEEEFRLHKRDYYINKLLYQEVDSHVLTEQAHCYVRAIQWNLHYYYNGCVSWGWFYPHNYAPYISDITDFHNINLEFEMGEPFKPYEQLLAVLPAASKDLLPKAYQKLVTETNSPLIDYYPHDFELDLNGKTQAWEAIVLIPFIDERRLLAAAKSCEKELTSDEKRYNCHGPTLLYTYSDSIQKPYLSLLPDSFSSIQTNHAKCTVIDGNTFRIPLKRIKKGLMPNVRLDLYFPGFPTLKYVKHKASLRKAGVRVFQMTSKGDNMMLEIEPIAGPLDIYEISRKYLGKQVYINWPFLIEGKVTKVATIDDRYVLVEGRKIVHRKMLEKEREDFGTNFKSYVKLYRDRRGIIVGPTEVLLYVQVTADNTNEKRINSHGLMCPLQAVVEDIAVYKSSKVRPEKTVARESFQAKEPVFENLWKGLQNMTRNNPENTENVRRPAPTSQPLGRQISLVDLMQSASPGTCAVLPPSNVSQLQNLCIKKFGMSALHLDYSIMSYGPMQTSVATVKLPDETEYTVAISPSTPKEIAHEKVATVALQNLVEPPATHVFPQPRSSFPPSIALPRPPEQWLSPESVRYNGKNRTPSFGRQNHVNPQPHGEGNFNESPGRNRQHNSSRGHRYVKDTYYNSDYHQYNDRRREPFVSRMPQKWTKNHRSPFGTTPQFTVLTRGNDVSSDPDDSELNPCASPFVPLQVARATQVARHRNQSPTKMSTSHGHSSHSFSGHRNTRQEETQQTTPTTVNEKKKSNSRLAVNFHQNN